MALDLPFLFIERLEEDDEEEGGSGITIPGGTEAPPGGKAGMILCSHSLVR